MNERADHLVSYLVRKNSLSPVVAAEEPAETLIYYALVDFDQQTELAAIRARTPASKSQIAHAKDKKHVLSAYVNGADSEELLSMFDHYRWVPPRSGDYSKWAASALGKYLSIKKQNETYEVSLEMKRQAKEWDYQSQRQLRDVILDFYEDGTFSSAYAQQLMLVLGQVTKEDLHPRVSREVLLTARQQGAVKLRRVALDVQRETEDPLHSSALNMIFSVVGQSVGSIRDVPEVTNEYAEERGVSVDEAREQVDALLSLGLQHVYRPTINH